MNSVKIVIGLVTMALALNGYLLDKAAVWVPMHLLLAIPRNHGRNMPFWIIGYFAFFFVIGFLPLFLGVIGIILTFFLGLAANALVFHQPALEALVAFCFCVAPLVCFGARLKHAAGGAAIGAGGQDPPDAPEDNEGKALASNAFGGFGAFKTPNNKPEFGGDGPDHSALYRHLQSSVQVVPPDQLDNPEYLALNGLQNNQRALRNLQPAPHNTHRARYDPFRSFN